MSHTGHTEHLIRPDGVRLVTPESLRAHVEHGGGRITRERDYRYTPEQGGDGEQGVLTLTFATADGDEIGSIGFTRSKSTDGRVHFHAADFTDKRRGDAWTRRGDWIHRDPQGAADLLAAFTPIPYTG